jgi:hypothetical protein
MWCRMDAVSALCSMTTLDSLSPCRLMGAAWKLARSMMEPSRPPARSLQQGGGVRAKDAQGPSG